MGRYNIVSGKDSIPELIEHCADGSQDYGNKIDIKGIVFSEGSFAQQCNFDRFTPGNKLILWNCDFSSKFEKFRHTGSGIMCGTETTCLSILPGEINEVGVLFVHPTSREVDYQEIKDYFSEHFPDLFFIEADQNFISSIRDHVKDI